MKQSALVRKTGLWAAGDGTTAVLPSLPPITLLALSLFLISINFHGLENRVVYSLNQLEMFLTATNKKKIVKPTYSGLNNEDVSFSLTTEFWRKVTLGTGQWLGDVGTNKSAILLTCSSQL